jgi:hypothetical protein
VQARTGGAASVVAIVTLEVKVKGSGHGSPLHTVHLERREQQVPPLRRR